MNIPVARITAPANVLPIVPSPFLKLLGVLIHLSEYVEDEPQNVSAKAESHDTDEYDQVEYGFAKFVVSHE